MSADQGQASRLQARPSVQSVEGRTQALRCLGEPLVAVTQGYSFQQGDSRIDPRSLTLLRWWRLLDAIKNRAKITLQGET